MSATPILVRTLVFAGARFECFLWENFCFITETSCAFGSVICVRMNC